MSKKLKKKIEELCGIVDSPWEQRAERAQDILDSNEWKQKLCNQLPGLSYRELEKFLTNVLNERIAKEANESAKAFSKRNGNGREVGHNVKSSRSLEEILAQVYAPRVENGLSSEQKASLRRPREEEGGDPDEG